METLNYKVSSFSEQFSTELTTMLELMLNQKEYQRPDWIELEEHVMNGCDDRDDSLLNG